MRRTRGIAALVGVRLLCLTAGCAGESDNPGALGTLGGDERLVLFEPGQVTYAQRSTIHVGRRTFDVSPQLVDSLDWTPYGLFLNLTTDLDNGPFEVAFYDGEAMTPIEDVYGDIVTSPDGELAAWIDRSGPERPAGRVAQAVVVDVSSGEVVFSSAEGMGGEKGDDLADLYEELPPRVVELTDQELVWVNSAGSGTTMRSDLETGETTASDEEQGWYPSTSGYRFRSPDGKHRVDATRTGRLKVRPRQPDFGHRWQTHGGWLGDDVMLVLGQDRYGFFPDAKRPDKLPGFILACDLSDASCDVVERVVGARDVVFAGIDIDP